MPYAAVNGQNVHYEDIGTGAGSWDERGHGRTASSESCEPFSYYDSADDLAALLGHLDIAHAVLVGMSQPVRGDRFALDAPTSDRIT